MKSTCLLVGLVLLTMTTNLAAQQDQGQYVRKPTRNETIIATLKANDLPTLEGPWYVIGPFDNKDNTGFDTAYPPEKEINFDQSYPGKGRDVSWSKFPKMKLGQIVDLLPVAGKPSNDSVVYLYHEIEAREAILIPLDLGSDDGIKVWLNGVRILEDQAQRAAAPDQNRTELKLKPGRNQLLLKITNNGGDFAVYVMPDLAKSLPGQVKNQFARDFPQNRNPSSIQNTSAESRYYQISTVQLPQDCVLEVGGLGFRPDGKLLACTRRGEVWLFDNPLAENPDDIKASLFAKGLHEALGLRVENNNIVYVVQRPELTKLVDLDGDGKADDFITVCDRWGVSGDYHEFAFGLPRDKDGNFYITLNVGFGGGHQSKGWFRGWCVKVTPKGEMELFAVGLRSPNGITINPKGELFYTDNQGEWVATNKLHHLKKGMFVGHPAGLRWVKNSPFASAWPKDVISGMLYDGQKGPNPNSPEGMPRLNPPAIWFPYGKMGQSASEPIFDTTEGKFGPFAGQCFVGDQTKAMIMRVDLEEVNGVYQGACFPFCGGFQCGVNRLAFAADGTLFAGQTNRGWGSLGGKSYGLQRLRWSGMVPFEIHTMRLLKNGFELTFTKPINRASAEQLKVYNMNSYTYVYSSNYGCPETDRKIEKISGVTIGEDGKSVRIEVNGLRPGRVYELYINDLKSADGDDLLHKDAWYTVNELSKR